MSKSFLLLALPMALYAQVWNEGGVATHFQAIGNPFGACGVPEAVLVNEKASDYVALNVFNTPTIFPTRPLTGADKKWLGLYDNGRNCGRWLEVELGGNCSVANGGEPGQPICGGNEANWKPDSLNGAKLYAIVTDQCSDDNGWCRDNANHIDIHTPALNNFRLPSGNLIPPYAFEQNGSWSTQNYNNRQVRWRFIPAPNIKTDLNIHYSEGSKPEWRRIIVTNLPNGIHGVEQWVGVDGAGTDQWQAATMGGDMGQMFVLPRADLPDPMKIRVFDANDSLVYGGRTYSFSFPASCSVGCTVASVPVDYVATGGVFPPAAITLPLPSSKRNLDPTAARGGLFARMYNLLGQSRAR